MGQYCYRFKSASLFSNHIIRTFCFNRWFCRPTNAWKIMKTIAGIAKRIAYLCSKNAMLYLKFQLRIKEANLFNSRPNSNSLQNRIGLPKTLKIKRHAYEGWNRNELKFKPLKYLLNEGENYAGTSASLEKCCKII